MRSALVLAGPGGTPAPGDASLERVVETVAPLVEDLVVACPDHRRSTVTEALDEVSRRLAVDPRSGGL